VSRAVAHPAERPHRPRADARDPLDRRLARPAARARRPHQRAAAAGLRHRRRRVVNSNAFVWKPDRTAGDYLRLAGADEAADTDNMFILRADGTVSSAGDRRGFFGRGGIESEVLQPGDALVVPNQLDFETWGRALMRT
jgi:hypothetical protein